jgi:putative heme-binding domain-containing protein
MDAEGVLQTPKEIAMDAQGFLSRVVFESADRRFVLGRIWKLRHIILGLTLILFAALNPVLSQETKPAQYGGSKPKSDPSEASKATQKPTNPQRTTSPKPQPKLIWVDPVSPGGKKAGDAYLRRVMELPDIEKAYLELDVSLGAEVFFNGRRVRTVKPKSGKERVEISGLTRPGKNCLAIRVFDPDDESPGVRAEFYFKPSGGNWRVVISDSEWLATKLPIASWQMIGLNDEAWMQAISIDAEVEVGEESIAANQNDIPIDNLGGRSDAPAGSEENLNRMPSELGASGVPKPLTMRADTANAPGTRAKASLDTQAKSPVSEKVAKRFKTVPGFSIEELASPEIGSVLAMTFNEFGHIIASLEGGGLVLLYDNSEDGLPTKTRSYCDLIKNVQGILPLNGDVYVTGEGPEGIGLYKLVDEDRNGELEKSELLMRFEGVPGEHGVHQIALGPDGFIYISLGNQAIAPRDSDVKHSFAPPYEGDLVQPRMEDPGGHASGIKAPGGTVVRYDLSQGKLSIVAGGLRNAYDLAFHPNGSLYLHDSDMEADIGAVWHRPTGLFRIVEGGEYGWRSGWANWPDYYLDRLPSLADTGRGSPTGIAIYTHFQFPARYHRAIFTADWSEGRIIALPIDSVESGQVKAEDFVVGTPMNVTDIEVGPDGGLYFCTGGRGTEGGIFRVRWDGEIPQSYRNLGEGISKAVREPQLYSAYGRQAIAVLKREMGDEWDAQVLGVAFSEENPARYRLQALDLMQLLGPMPTPEILVELSNATNEQVRAKCARLMGLHPEQEMVEQRLRKMLGDRSPMVRIAVCEALIRLNAVCEQQDIEPLLMSDVREDRYFGRRLLQNIPIDVWKEEMLKSKTRTAIQASLALVANDPSSELAIEAVSALVRVSKGFVSDADFLDLLRTLQVALGNGRLKPSDVPDVVDFVEREFPTGNATINGELIRLATYLRCDMVPQCVEYLKLDVSIADRMLIAMHLPLMPHEWTSHERMAVLQFLETCLKEKTGSSYPLYVMKASEGISKHLTEREALQILELGQKYPNAALSALFKIESKLNRDQIAMLANLDTTIDKGGLEEDTYKRLKTGITAVLSQQDEPSANEYLQQRWRKSPDRRASIALALAQKPSEENWDYLVRSMSVLELFAVPDVCNALMQIDAVTDDADAIRQTILQGCKLAEANQDPTPTRKLLEYWTNETPTQTETDIQSPMGAWQEWFAQRYPDSPPATLPSEKDPPRWSLEFLEEYLNGEQGREGSAVLGAAVYAKARCSACHKMNTQGSGFGPDLTSVNRRFTRTEVLESILFPSHVISDQYASKKVVTKDGEIYNGIVVNTPKGIAVRVNETKEFVLANEDIEEIAASKVSSMPAGLLDELSPTEIRDLMCFLGFLPEEKKAAEKPATIRR